MKIGLLPVASQIAAVALEEAKAKKGRERAHRRITSAVMPLLEEAALVGLDQAVIAVRGNPEAVLAIEARRRELTAAP